MARPLNAPAIFQAALIGIAVAVGLVHHELRCFLEEKSPHTRRGFKWIQRLVDFSPSCRQRTDGHWGDRAGFEAHARKLRELVRSVHIDVLDELR